MPKSRQSSNAFCWFSGTPNTKKRAKNYAKTKNVVTKSPDTANYGDLTIITPTQKKRYRSTRRLKFSYQRLFHELGANTQKNLECVLYEPVDTAGNVSENVTASSQSLSVKGVQKFGDELNPIVIDPQKHSREKPRSKYPSQNKVMNDQSAKAIYQSMYARLNEQQKQQLEQQYGVDRYPDMHWCHLIAFCLLNGTDTNPQQVSNLAAGTAQCNQNMRHFEMILKHHLNNGSLDRLELWGEASLVNDEVQAVASEITLNIKAYANGYHYKTQLNFPALSTQVENKMASHAYEVMQQAVLRY